MTATGVAQKSPKDFLSKVKFTTLSTPAGEQNFARLLIEVRPAREEIENLMATYFKPITTLQDLKDALSVVCVVALEERLRNSQTRKREEQPA